MYDFMHEFLWEELGMEIDISIAPFEKKHVLRNMLELYFYDLSEFDDENDRLELNDAGLFGYGYLDYYWSEKGRFAYLLRVDGRLAGFVLIRTVGAEPLTFSVAEFFVVRKYRRLGLGSLLIFRMFELHKGKWLISTPIKNSAAQQFWRKIIKSASLGRYEEYLTDDGRRLEWAFDKF
jgi:predicted acetyltransferase